MTSTSSKINFDKFGYYILGLIPIVLLGFWKSYFSELIAGTSRHASIFHFHGMMMSLWIAMLLVQPLLIRKKQFAAHRIIGKVSFVVMPLLLLSILQIMHYEGNLFPENELTFIGTMNGVITMSTFYLIAIWNKSSINIHARAMVCTGITMIQPASDRIMFNIFNMQAPTVFYVSWVMIYLLLIALMIIERKQKVGRWVFPLYLGMHIIFVSSMAVITKIPVIDPAFGKWFLTLPLTTAPTVIVKDLPIPESEIDRYPGKWGDNGESEIYKRGHQLWERWIENGKADSTRLLYQGKSEFIPDRNKPFKSLYFLVKDGKTDAFSVYYGGIGNSGQTKRMK
ncbi:hypothetical protein NF867_15215 [Solitalea sp. MAHUQ-68]|uniref:Uncharacterized protein n=1 Tax=Solitalea agri TaxID=2953739 RepID=A0A9X2F3Q3_9SPHI|nr:hypothetical protein [Solitalea agri]MCO4294209.1 hypothetical protein [Solitalea agri]